MKGSILIGVWLFGLGACRPADPAVVRQDQLAECRLIQPAYGNLAACLVLRHEWSAEDARFEQLIERARVLSSKGNGHWRPE